MRCRPITMGQERVATSQRPRPQPAAQLSAPHARGPEAGSSKRTYAFVLRSMRTLRFLLIARAGRLARIDGRRQVLRLSENPATEALYGRVVHALGRSDIFGSGLTIDVGMGRRAVVGFASPRCHRAHIERRWLINR